MEKEEERARRKKGGDEKKAIIMVTFLVFIMATLAEKDKQISVWICKNVATEISLICPLTESRSRAVFFRSYFLFI